MKYLIITLLFTTYTCLLFSQDAIKVWGGDVPRQNCASLKVQTPFDVTRDVAIKSADYMHTLKTIKTPIYIQIITPPRDPMERITFWIPSPPKDKKHWTKTVFKKEGKQFEMLVTPFPNEKSCWIINRSYKPNTYIEVSYFTPNRVHDLQMKVSQYNQESEEATKWFRLIEVPSMATPGHTIQFIIWHPETSS